MELLQSLQSPESPTQSCFCGYPASPCRDSKYCSERCAREDAENMLMGEPSHYRNVSQPEILERLVRSDSQCRVAKEILVDASVARGTGYEKLNMFKPLPPLPNPPQPAMFWTLVDFKDPPKRGDTLLTRLLSKRLLTRRMEQVVI